MTCFAALVCALAAAGPTEYLDYGRRAPFTARPSIVFDASGIPRVRYPGRRRLVYNPVTVAQHGLQQLSYYVRTGRRADLRRAVRAGRWFEQTQDRRSGEWLYGFRWRVVRTQSTLRPPWSSAMAQGQAISLLTRLYLATGQRRYVAAALRALQPLRRSVRRGGLVARLDGRPWYEEYPTSPPTFVLNGFMFTLLGLHDLAALRPRSSAGGLYRRGLRTLAAALPRYDTPAGSLYYLAGATPYVAPLRYQRLHVKLLSALLEISPDPVLRRYRDRWRRFSRTR
jgi:heparosan-N-sulfate-glucuronate 5-epimerase